MENSHEEIPEFDLFKRMESIELTQKDIAIIAGFGLELAFAAYCLHAPKQARKQKDILLGRLKTFGLNKQLLEWLAEDLTVLCDIYDQ